MVQWSRVAWRRVSTEQKQGDDLVLRLHNVHNVQNVHMEYAGVIRGYTMYTKDDSLSTSNLHQLFWS